MRIPSHNAILSFLVCGVVCLQVGQAQEASSGFDIHGTFTAQAVASSELTEAPRSGSPIIVGSRSVAYPTYKINDNWLVTGAMQLTTRPYYFNELSNAGCGAKGTLLQATLNYAHISPKGSVLVRAGVMPTAFGSFMLHYDDTDSFLVDLPIEYGYYYSPVSIMGVTGAQVDATEGKWDARLQFANSSPANPRSLSAHDQYGNWAGGAGYTIRQGLRLGVSGYRGPYLDRKYQYFFPGEVNPSKLPATAVGVDGNWTRGHTTVQGELQRFTMPYTVIPSFHEIAGYGELKHVLSPRWYVAFRGGYSSSNAAGKTETTEASAGFRPGRLQLIKMEYEARLYGTGDQQVDNRVAIQYVTTLHWAAGRE
jgi:hypothetical protein